MPFLLPSLSKRVHWQKKVEGGAPSPGLDGAHTPPHSYIKFQEQNEFLMDFFWHKSFSDSKCMTHDIH